MLLLPRVGLRTLLKVKNVTDSHLHKRLVESYLAYSPQRNL